MVMSEIHRLCDDNSFVWNKRSGEVVEPNTANLYDIVGPIIMKWTKDHNCSFVELVAEDASKQLPKWFVSHWWGEPVQAMLDCLIQHAFDHCLDEDTPYWVCAYANNQVLNTHPTFQLK